MRNRLKALRRPPADARGGRRRILVLGVRRLEIGQLAHEPIEFRVGDLGRVVDVVTLFVVTNEGPQPRDAFGDGHEWGLTPSIDRGT
jgi:hypothetical protein